MHKKIREVMNAHEKDNPQHRKLNDLAIEDMKSLGEINPGKPFALQVGYSLDGHHDNRDRYKRNYDYGLLSEEKKDVNREIFDLAELGAMLHDPEYIADLSHKAPSENHQMAKQILDHYLEKLGPHESHRSLEKELYEPMLNMIMDRSIDEEGILHSLLAHKMVRDSDHLPKDYSKMLKSLVLMPVIEGHKKKHWEQKLPLIFETMRGKEND